jgi:hypothetical protein
VLTEHGTVLPCAMPPDDLASVIAAANDTLAEVKRMCAESLFQWNENKDAPVGARVIHGIYPGYMVVVAEINVEGRVRYSGMVSGPKLAATVLPTEIAELCYGTGSKAIAAKTSGA